MQAEDLDKLQDSIRASLAEDGLSAALSALKKALPEQTEKYNLVFQLETRLNRINKDRIKGILSQEQLEIAYNRLSNDILNLVSELQPADFDPATANEAQGKRKTGALLYQIPRKMELDPEKSYRCIVRLAFNEDLVVENLDLTRDTEVKPVRVSEIMEVELKDPNDAPAFQIQLINSAEQFLEENAYTEWQFKVKPLRAGALPLLLVVAIKEYLHNRPVKREIVLEEVIEVFAEPLENIEDTADLQSAGYTFLYSSEGDERKGSVAIGTYVNKYGMVASVLLIFMVAAGIWALGTKLGWFNTIPKFIEKPKQENNTQSSPKELKPTVDSVAKTQDTVTILPADSSKIKLADTLITDQEKPKTTGKVSSKTKSRNPSKNNKNTTPVSKIKSKETQTLETPKQPGLEPGLNANTTQNKTRKSGFMMVRVEGGKLSVGKHYGNKPCPEDTLKISSFRLGKYEITQADWQEIMGKNPAFKKGCADCPVENVSWNDAQEFIQKASKVRVKNTGYPMK